MAFSSEIIVRRRITNNSDSKRKDLYIVSGNFASDSSSTGGEIDVGFLTIKGFPQITVNAAKDHHVTVSLSMLTIVYATGVTSGSFRLEAHS